MTCLKWRWSYPVNAFVLTPLAMMSCFCLGVHSVASAQESTDSTLAVQNEDDVIVDEAISVTAEKKAVSLPLPPLPEQELDQPEWLIEAANILPLSRQADWQDYPLTGYLHYGLAAFTQNSWDSGTESPELFRPKSLNCEQWAQTAKAAGIDRLMLPGKHWDGFCLWQTRYTDYSVASTSWSDGEGDVLRDLIRACHKHDIKVGLFYSSRDRNQALRENGLYGNGSQKTTRTIPEQQSVRSFPEDHITYTYDDLDDYNAYVLNQLYELLTEYGPIDQLFIDASVPHKTGQSYAHEHWWDLARKLQPDIIISSKGPDARWSGNLSGASRSSEYSAIPIGDPEVWDDRMQHDLGSREVLRQSAEAGHRLQWCPFESYAAMRPSNYFRPEETGHPRGHVSRLLDYYYAGPGNNGNCRLILAPDDRGLIHELDASRLAEFGYIIRKTFERNLALGATAHVSSSVSGHGPEALVDGNDDTYWQLAEGENRGWIQLDFDEAITFDIIDLAEYTRACGQRIESFYVTTWDGEEWNVISRGTTVGHRKSIRLPRTVTKGIRLHITSARSNPSLRHIGLYLQPARVETPVIARHLNNRVHIENNIGTDVYYTTDGSKPTVLTGTRYTEPFLFEGKGTIKAIAVDSENPHARISAVEFAHFDVNKSKWTIHDFTSDQPQTGEQVANAIDGQTATIWHSQYWPETLELPQGITINFNEQLNLKGIVYIPRSDDSTNGNLAKYRVEVKADENSEWVNVAESIFYYQESSSEPQQILFDKSHNVKFLRFTALSEVNGFNYASIAEIDAITE